MPDLYLCQRCRYEVPIGDLTRCDCGTWVCKSPCYSLHRDRECQLQANCCRDEGEKRKAKRSEKNGEQGEVKMVRVMR